ncbi:MAG: exodeoxyribonuclease V subunit beta [Balneolaceae bacterium]
MSEPKPYSILNTPLNPRTLIEASAGSGKTYTLTGIYVRLLIEGVAEAEQMVVLTFTRKAAGELKERIEQLLRRVLHSLQSESDPGEELVRSLVVHARSFPGALERLESAFASLDQAMIGTIDSFCQRVLRDQSLVSGTAVEFDLDPQEELFDLVLQDELLRLYHAFGSGDRGLLLRQAWQTLKAGTPDALKKELGARLRNREALRGEQLLDPQEILEKRLFPLVDQMVELRDVLLKRWGQERESLLATLGGYKMHKTGYFGKVDRMVDRVETELNNHLGSSKDLEALSFFSKSFLESKRNKPETREIPSGFPDACDRLVNELVPALEEGMMDLARSWIAHVERQHEAREAQLDQLSYDGLKRTLRDALADPNRGEGLIRRLRELYPVAMLDEFQDTDPVQYEIFSTLYPASGQGLHLFMIGDPKQAIYGFRGGDVFAYLKAKREIPPEMHYTLGKNYRSRPELVEAINEIFSPPHGCPFLLPEIPYHPVDKGREEKGDRWIRDEQTPVPVTMVIPDPEHESPPGVEEKAEHIANEVYKLLQEGEQGSARLSRSGEEERPVRAGDIAILVRTRYDVEKVRSALNARSIRAATRIRESVFRTQECIALLRLGEAILEPGSGGAFEELALTGWLGRDLAGIIEDLHSEEKREFYRTRFLDLQKMWEQEGLFTAVRHWLVHMNGARNLAELADAERVLTNLNQLLQWVSELERRESPGMGETLQTLWREHQQESRTEEEELDLESDDDLVQICTIHASKGLEFPIVFCYSLNPANKKFFQENLVDVCHGGGPEYSVRVEWGGAQNQERKQEVQAVSRLEQLQEEVRLAYVAITRAQLECRIYVDTGDFSHLTGLGGLVRGPEAVETDLQKESKKAKLGTKEGHPVEEFLSQIEEAWSHRPDLIAWDGYSGAEKRQVVNSDSEEPASAPLPIRPYEGPSFLHPHRRKLHFTRLMRQSGSSEAWDGRDYDGWLDEIEQEGDREPVEPERSIHTFPRGADAGTFIHKLMEHTELDFRRPETFVPVIRETSRAHGVESEWESVLEQMMAAVTRARIGEIELSRVGPNDRLVEMEFHFPASNASAETLLRTIRGEKTSNPESADLFSIHPRETIMNGFVDLVARLDGRYYIVDYKSNHLGDEPEAYAPDRLKEAMEHSGYDLQYHIYLVALVNFLKQQLPDFDYERHIGGAAYLFVRGMNAGSDHGVFFHKPKLEILQELESIWGWTHHG